MKQQFDILGRYKYPDLKLCKPDRTGQGYIFGVNNLNIKINFNFLHDLSFEIDWLLDGKENPLYDKILGDKVIYTREYGYFIINNITIEGSGVGERKIVTAVSAEAELARNKLSRIEKTIKLYNPLNPNDVSTLLGFFIQQNPRWKIGTVDSELWTLYRTFDVQTTDWYNFLIRDVSEKFMCIFKFDNVNRVLHCHTVEGSTKQTNIFASYDNLIDSISIEEKTDGVYTALNCTGAGYLDIRSVNPLGTNVIINLDFYKTEEWMTTNLINKINLWEKQIEIHQKPYKDLLTTLRENQVLLTNAEIRLTEFETEISALEQAKAISKDDPFRYAEIVDEINKIKDEMSKQKRIIDEYKVIVENINSQMKQVNDLLSLENNFTPDEINKIQDLIKMDNYQNDGFKKTDIMTPYEIQDESQQLYDHCLALLKIVSRPKYYFSANMVNFIFLEEYEKFTKQADVGSIITVEIKKGWRTKVVLLSITLNFDDPNDFVLEFSNRHRLDNGKFEFNDLFTDTSYSSGNIDWDKAIISDPVKSGLLQEVNNFINGNLDAAKNALITAKGIGVTIDSSGIHGRRYIDNVLQGTELWITNDTICISKDNFNSVPGIAIGRFKLPNSDNYAYGVNAEFLAGRLVVGNQFVFEAENGSFSFDGSGATLTNAVLKVTNNINTKRTLIDPDNGFKIQSRKNPDMPWEDKVFLDNDGNANFIGITTTESGLIGGWTIEKNGLSHSGGQYYLKSDGTGKLGLMEFTNSTATFKGNIYANNLRTSDSDGWIGNKHIKDKTISGTKLESSFTDGISTSIAKVETIATANSARIESLTQWSDDTVKTISSITQQANENSADIKLVVSYSGTNSRQINTASIVASVNQSGSGITIKADKINFQGFTTFVRPNDLSAYGSTTIDGGRIKTGTIDANRVTVVNLNADNITTGSISANRIKGGTIDGVKLTWGGNELNSLSSNGYSAQFVAGNAITIKAPQNINLNCGYSSIGMSNSDNSVAITSGNQINLFPRNVLNLGTNGCGGIYLGNSGSVTAIRGSWIYVYGSLIKRDTINYKLTDGRNASMHVLRWEP